MGVCVCVCWEGVIVRGAVEVLLDVSIGPPMLPASYMYHSLSQIR